MIFMNALDANIYMKKCKAMENKLENNIKVYTYVASDVHIKVHSFDDGHEEEIEIDNISGIEFTDYFEKYGKPERTCISYDTGWDDCPTDHIYVKESVEEVKALYNKAWEVKREISKKYSIVCNNEKYHTVKVEILDELYGIKEKYESMINKVCDYLKTYRRDTEDGTGYIAGIIDDKTIEDVRKLMES